MRKRWSLPLLLVFVPLVATLAFLATTMVAPSPALARSGDITFVETDVELGADDGAVVIYTVQWQVASGELHGFYFEEQDNLRIQRFSSDSYAVDSDGNRYALDINQVGPDRYDIVLADGRGVADGS
ncbi:hypothetical protein BMS3Abin01_01320 [bacterium BMS3Abin01]|nr:hypothetical protein BMS3Abin01_01320 [bacterium BMS3Abin01]